MAKQVKNDEKFTSVRLPISVKPIHYELSLKPDLEKFVFEGSVKIQYQTTGPVREVVLHAVDLEISDGHVQSEDEGTVSTPLSTVTYSQSSETATLEFGGAEIPASGQLSLRFKGLLTDSMKGFYRTSFKLNNQIVYAATTQFEAVDARRSFPCWDEPACKATFTVELITDTILKVVDENSAQPVHTYPIVALSNMPPKSVSELPDGKTKTIFEKTPIMSTYLLAYIVGPFEMIEGSDGKRPIRVYTTPGKKEQGTFALEVAIKSLKFYDDYFNIPYPLPKMDLVAIPDFTSGAMENWGLVTYRETCLLVDKNNTATVMRQYVAIVVAHELAHQWFGNLVTMEWWTHLWLNEGFASFMEYLCVDKIFPEYDLWSQFITDAYGMALSLDSLHNSHPIEVPVYHPSEIDEIFDIISYKKGASVIRMLYNYIGDECFRAGMKQYLSKYAYKNTSTEDLWECLGAASGKPICKIMSTWTAQKGYPWLTVESTSEGTTTKLTLTQNKFTADGKLPQEDASSSWLIPIDVLVGTKELKQVSLGLMEGKKSVFTVEANADSLIKLNAGSISLYRTAYPEAMQQKLWSAISGQILSPIDRLQLQNDYFALCQAGQVKTVDLLKLLEAFKDETNLSVWRSIDSCMSSLNTLLSYTDYHSNFHAFGRKLYSEILKKLTWNAKKGEPDSDAMTRALVINRMISFGDEAVIEEAKHRYDAQRAGKESILADLRGSVYKVISIYGNEEAFNGLFEIFRSSDLHAEKDRAAVALGMSKDPERVKRVLEFVYSDEVRNQDKPYVIRAISVTNPPLAWNQLKERKDYFKEKYMGTHLIGRVVKFCIDEFATEEMAQEISKFFEENKFPGAERTIQQSLETIRLRANWLARDKEPTKAFLSKY